MIGMTMRQENAPYTKNPVVQACSYTFACIKKNIESSMINPG
jgi:hypothetical protein